MNRFFLIMLGPLSAALLAAACGGVAGDSLFGSTGTGGAVFSSSSGSATGGHTTSTTSTSTSSSTSSGSSSTSSSTSTSSTSSTSSSTSTSSTSTSSGTTATVYCDGMACPGGDVCCYDPDEGNPIGPDYCSTKNHCNMGYSELSCSGPAGCPGSYCCATFTVAGTPPNQYRHYSGISCQPTCNDIGSQIIICDPAAANACPFGGTCQPSSLLGTPYNICG